MIAQAAPDNFMLKKDFGCKQVKTFTFHAVSYNLRIPLIGNRIYAGIDPGGVHLGISIIKANVAHVYELRLMNNMDTLDRIPQVHKAFEYAFLSVPRINSACVEQASYGNPYGQVALGEARTTLIIGLMNMKYVPRIVIAPPSSIKKEVFGHGRIRAEEFWRDIYIPATPKTENHINDGLAALSCAFYAYAQENKHATKAN